MHAFAALLDTLIASSAERKPVPASISGMQMPTFSVNPTPRTKDTRE